MSGERLNAGLIAEKEDSPMSDIDGQVFSAPGSADSEGREHSAAENTGQKEGPKLSPADSNYEEERYTPLENTGQKEGAEPSPADTDSEEERYTALKNMGQKEGPEPFPADTDSEEKRYTPLENTDQKEETEPSPADTSSNEERYTPSKNTGQKEGPEPSPAVTASEEELYTHSENTAEPSPADIDPEEERYTPSEAETDEGRQRCAPAESEGRHRVQDTNLDVAELAQEQPWVYGWIRRNYTRWIENGTLLVGLVWGIAVLPQLIHFVFSHPDDILPVIAAVLLTAYITFLAVVLIQRFFFLFKCCDIEMGLRE